VRELENVLERAFLFYKGHLIEDLPLEALLGSGASPDHEVMPLQQIKRETLNKAEVAAIEEALTRFRGNVSAAARAMGITPQAVRMKLKTYRLNADTCRR
jgi:DNA-binding NtrC family response regulator